MFLHLCVILFTGEGVYPTPLDVAPRLGRTPWMQTLRDWADPPGCRRPLVLDRPPRCRPSQMQTPPLGWADSPWMQTPQMQTPQGWADPPPQMQTPRGWGRPPTPHPIRSTSWRYASYWNAYLIDWKFFILVYGDLQHIRYYNSTASFAWEKGL